MSELRIVHLRKQFGEQVVVNDLNLVVHSGEMVSLLGPSGCGKTTTLRMIAGLQQPTSGSITLDGRELTTVPPHKRNVGLVFQNYALFPHLNVFENVAFGLRRHKVPKREIRPRVEAALQSVQLTEFEKRMPSQLSGGQQQRVALARTLVLQPSLVLFDEPLSNLDAKLRSMLRVEIRKLQQQFGFTGIFVTHDQEEAMVLSDRIAVMNQGQIAQIGTPRQIYTAPADPFVADFVGESNLLPVAGAETQDGMWKLALAGGHEVRAPRTESSGPPRNVMIRPESADLVKSDADIPAGHNSLQGIVTFIQYTGSTYTVEMDVAGLPNPIMVKIRNTNEDIGFRIGDPIRAIWPVSTTYAL